MSCGALWGAKWGARRPAESPAERPALWGRQPGSKQRGGAAALLPVRAQAPGKAKSAECVLSREKARSPVAAGFYPVTPEAHLLAYAASRPFSCALQYRESRKHHGGGPVQLHGCHAPLG
jgi:hypothetical protein